jgi:hypothetical protein
VPQLHIVQGGISNGDKDVIERRAKHHGRVATWIVPKSSRPGDDVAIYIPEYGLFATAIIDSVPKPRKDWVNRYGAALRAIERVNPAISIGTLKRRIPTLIWANYPRSITTPDETIAIQLRELIRDRRKTGLPDTDDTSLYEASLEELRAVAVLGAQSKATKLNKNAAYRVRSMAIKLYVLARANGHCEYCEVPAPFNNKDGKPYLEPHHTTRLADDGPDHPAHVISLCPNCHRRAHHSEDAAVFNKQLKARIRRIESE